MLFGFASRFDQDQALGGAPLVKTSEPIRCLNAPATPCFGSPVIGLDAFDLTDLASGDVIFTDSLKDPPDLVANRRVVFIARHHVTGGLLSNLVGNLLLRIERIDRDDAVFEVK